MDKSRRLGCQALSPLLLAIALAGCGDEDTKIPLTCEVLQSGDFCWPASVEEARMCIDDPDAVGQLNQDRTRCDFEDGLRVHFDEPLPMGATGDTPWRFSLERDGDTCASFSESETSQSLETASGLLEVTSSSGFGIDVACPDGTRYHAENAFDLFDCEGGLTALPGVIKSSGGSVVSFGFTGTEGGAPLWRCQAAD